MMKESGIKAFEQSYDQCPVAGLHVDLDAVFGFSV